MNRASSGPERRHVDDVDDVDDFDDIDPFWDNSLGFRIMGQGLGFGMGVQLFIGITCSDSRSVLGYQFRVSDNGSGFRVLYGCSALYWDNM